MYRRERRLVWWWQNSSFVPGASRTGAGRQAMYHSHDPYEVLVGVAGRTLLGSVWSRGARRGPVCFPGGPDVCQALERPPMPAHARGGHPVTVGTRACQETRRAPLRDLVRHVRVPAPRVDQLVRSQH